MKLEYFPKVYAAIGKAFIVVVIVSVILSILDVISREQMFSCILAAFSVAGLAIFGVGAMHEDARRKKLIEQGKDPDEEDE